MGILGSVGKSYLILGTTVQLVLWWYFKRAVWTIRLSSFFNKTNNSLSFSTPNYLYLPKQTAFIHIE